jgi:MFS family permease
MRDNRAVMTTFHGWRMVAAGGGLQFLQAGLMQQAFGAYVAVLSVERGWSKTSLSIAAALQSVETAIVGPLLGWLCDRFGPHRLIRIGIVVFGLGLVLLGLIDSLAGFYAAVVVIALGSSLAGYFPINVAIIQWFERKRARAMSATALGLALGGMAVPVVALSIVTFGWRATAIGSGLLAIAFGLPLSRQFRGRPEELGQTLDGLPPRREPARAAGVGATPAALPAARAPAAAPDRTQAAGEYTLREALRTRAFWLVSAGHGAALLVVTAVNVHAITHMKESLGYTVSEASLVIMLMTLAQIVGVLLGIAYGDRSPKRLLAAGCMGLHALGLLALTYSAGAAMLAFFAVLHGVAWGLRGPLMQAIRADYFGRRSIGMIMGISSVVTAVGQVCGPLVAGGLADLTGDYRLGFTVLALLALGGAAAFVAAVPPARRPGA